MRIFTSLLFCYCVFFEDPAVGAENSAEFDLKVLGTVGEKTYLVDTGGILRNWTESKAICESRGLSLASITSNNQAEFLKQSYDPTQFNGWFWVNARKGKQGNPGLSWEDTNKPVQEFENLWISYWRTDEEDGDCLCYSSNNQKNAYYFKRGCYHRHHTLCESFKPVESIPNTGVIEPKTKSRVIQLGSVDGKTYLSDHILRNWNDSHSFCKSLGLQLASVSSQAQKGFLTKASLRINYDGWFWIADRQFGSSEEEENQCPCYSPYNSNSFIRRCFYKHFTLCETLESKPSDLKISVTMDSKISDWEANGVSELGISVTTRSKPAYDVQALPEVGTSNEHSVLFKSVLEELHRELQEHVEKGPDTTSSFEQKLS